MNNHSLPFGYMEIKLNAGWEGWRGELGKLQACVVATFAFIEKFTYTRVYTVLVPLLLNAEYASRKCFIAKNWIINTNVIKSSCSENKFKIANLKNLVYIYLKMRFKIAILHVVFKYKIHAFYW